MVFVYVYLLCDVAQCGSSKLYWSPQFGGKTQSPQIKYNFSFVDLQKARQCEGKALHIYKYKLWGPQKGISIQTPGALPSVLLPRNLRLRWAFRLHTSLIIWTELFKVRRTLCSINTKEPNQSDSRHPHFYFIIITIVCALLMSVHSRGAHFDIDFQSEMWTFISALPQKLCALISPSQQVGVCLSRLQNISPTLQRLRKTERLYWSLCKPECACFFVFFLCIQCTWRQHSFLCVLHELIAGTWKKELV